MLIEIAKMIESDVFINLKKEKFALLYAKKFIVNVVHNKKGEKIGDRMESLLQNNFIETRFSSSFYSFSKHPCVVVFLTRKIIQFIVKIRLCRDAFERLKGTGKLVIT